MTFIAVRLGIFSSNLVNGKESKLKKDISSVKIDKVKKYAINFRKRALNNSSTFIKGRPLTIGNSKRCFSTSLSRSMDRDSEDSGIEDVEPSTTGNVHSTATTTQATVAPSSPVQENSRQGTTIVPNQTGQTPSGQEGTITEQEAAQFFAGSS